MKRIENTNYYVAENGDVYRPLKPRVKSGVRYWNLVIEGKVRAYSQIKVNKLTDSNGQEKPSEESHD